MKSVSNLLEIDLIHLTKASFLGCCQDDFKKPRQLRIYITGGIGDVEALLDEIRDAMGDRMNDTDWDITFEEVKRFGDHGPLHKGTIGFIEKP